MIKQISSLPLYIATAIIALALFIGLVLKKPYSFHGTVITPPFPVADFSLLTANGDVFRLSDQKGKIVLLFFGYTSCPDVCPITLATFKQAHERLGDDAQQVKFVMITANPVRDTPENVAEHAARSNPEFIALSGSLTDLEPIWQELGVFVGKQDSGSAEAYLVSHTASVYVLDQRGSLFMTFPYGTTAIDITDDIVQVLKQLEQE